MMEFEILANIWFYLMALIWSVYIAQESFIIGGGILASRFKNDEDYHKVNHIVGTHWDGIQVWIILAIAGMFASFPRAFTLVFSNLYIPVFLLLYAIVFRGASIELIYKTDNPKVKTFLKKSWQISSAVLFLIVGIYKLNLFMGLPIQDGSMNETFFSFMAIFNMVSIFGGILFISHALVAGTCFLKLNTSKVFIKPIEKIGKIASLASAFLMMVILMGLNHKEKYQIFTRGLYSTMPILWVLPIGAMILMLVGAAFIWLNKYGISFISCTIGMILFVFSGYSAMFPYIVVSSKGIQESMLITSGAAGSTTLYVMFISTLIFLPIVIGYQLYKYIRFWGDTIEN